MSVPGDIARMALRNLFRNARRSLLTGGMVAVGVVAIVFFRGYITGLQTLMYELVVENLSGAIQLERKGYSDAKDLAPLDLDLAQGAGLEELVRAAPGVRQLAPRLRFSALLMAGEKSTIVGGLGVDPKLEREVCPQSPQAGYRYEGRYGDRYGVEGPGLDGEREDAVLLGRELAAGMGLKVGDVVTLLAQTQKGSTDAVDATVLGVFRTGDAEVNKRTVLLPLALAQRLLHMPGRATQFAVAVERARLPEALASLRGALAGRTPAIDTRSWDEVWPYYRDVIRLQDQVMGIVTGLLFVLLLTGVINTMLMSVFERQREIGTLMAIGFRRRWIVALFVSESFALGVASAIAGAAAGAGLVAVGHVIGFRFTISGVGVITNYPRLDVGYLLVATAVAIGAALVAGLYPAFKASRMRPVEALSAT